MQSKQPSLPGLGVIADTSLTISPCPLGYLLRVPYEVAREHRGEARALHVLDLKHQGATHKQVQELLGVSAATVTDIVFGRTYRGRFNTHPFVRATRQRRKTNNGLVADLQDFTRAIQLGHLRWYGDPRWRDDWHEHYDYNSLTLKRMRIQDDLALGFSNRAIARRQGVSQVQVSRYSTGEAGANNSYHPWCLIWLQRKSLWAWVQDCKDEPVAFRVWSDAYDTVQELREKGTLIQAPAVDPWCTSTTNHGDDPFGAAASLLKNNKELKDDDESN